MAMAKTGLTLTDLPYDLFFVVISKLVDISDFIRLRATCKRWRPLISLSDSPPAQIPWIFNRRLISFGAHLEFYSLASGKFHTIHVPNASDKFLAGPAHGYLLAFDTRSSSLSLLNPLTCNEVALPPLALPSYFRPDLICAGEVVAISGFSSQKILVLASCRPGDDKWTVVERQVLTNFVGRSYYNGMYFVNDSEMGATTGIDAATGVVVFSVPVPVPVPGQVQVQVQGFDYLVESSGELLRIFRLSDDYTTLENGYFEIHRLDVDHARWVKLDGIGDRMIFLDSVHGLSLSLVGSGSPGLKLEGNSIYFMKPFFVGNAWSKFLCRYGIEDGTTQVLPFNVSKLGDGPWIVPSLH